MNQSLSFKEILAIGLMTFSLFLGAGNIIFPPTLGHDAGTDMWRAIGGFLITGVGLPLLGVAAVARAGGGIQYITNRVHPIFSIIFSVLTYLAIGPLLAIPRTGAVAYEISLAPFLPEAFRTSSWSLFLYTLVFFGVAYWLCLNPGKLVDRFGKVITPFMIVLLAILLIRGAIHPLGEVQASALPNPFSKGFLQGYNTMDALASLVFGGVIAAAVAERGVTNRGKQAKLIVQAGLIAVIGLGLLYVGLAYMGATSGPAVGTYANGGELITMLSERLLGSVGLILLALAITFACLTTAVGLITSCAEFFSRLTENKVSYRAMLVVFTIASLIIANFGLSTILKISVPILVTLYPLAIVLIVLTLSDSLFRGLRGVYIGAIIGAAPLSLLDGVGATGVDVTSITDALNQVPVLNSFMDLGLGWVIPALVGAIIGGIFSPISPAYSESHSAT
ncbi:LIVCS family branched-chain amino acid:cation transporter [Aneurinibacillus soli]|uniref:Branched-chain amino acid transport system carrier protein n=1 Tax=Aneurinibacillus soli TaxID=1500254 RepID=A0A0U5AU99_9BACL|nr:branched-chain amino acid transport system II carrier protein [Aneurinibacillus soli]PYE63745.1 LIVCS family branched-chain amino acid:cation transporter [Aneurinibacillus soli]BAU27322.1 Branched-chain amino acid transport system 2 carrier protein [Aneurinibacillus soli]